MELTNSKYKKIALFGDNIGIPDLIAHLPQQKIACLVAASTRAQYIPELTTLAATISKPLLIQPKRGTQQYENFYHQFSQINCDLIICHSYSMKIQSDILTLVKGNAINIHSSLLPKNRGPNPIQWAIIKGENQTGVTLHYMNTDIDCGDIIAQHSFAIDFKDTWVDVSNKAQAATKDIIANELPKVITGKSNRVKQIEEQATKNTRLTAESPVINLALMSDIEIYNLIRAQIAPLNGAYFIDKSGKKTYFRNLTPLESIKDLRKKFQTEEALS